MIAFALVGCLVALVFMAWIIVVFFWSVVQIARFILIAIHLIGDQIGKGKKSPSSRDRGNKAIEGVDKHHAHHMEPVHDDGDGDE